jgi:hypothetical protein
MNAARVGRPWMRSRHAVGATTQASRIASSHAYGGNALSPLTDPEDPDDVAVTARVDAYGATVRAARLVVYHSTDGLREAGFVGFDRKATIDRHRVRSSREARNPNRGCRFIVGFEAIRAGEVFALQRLVAWISPEEARPTATDGTGRTAHDGSTVDVQSLRLVVAADGEREADTETLDAFVTDRWVARFAVPSAQGLGQYFEVEFGSLGRAGHVWALDRMVLWIEDRADERPGEET